MPTVKDFREQQAELKLKSAQNPPPPSPPTPESVAPAATSPVSPTTDVDVDKDLPPKPVTQPPQASDRHDAHARLTSNCATETAREQKGDNKQEVIDKATAHKVKPTHRLKEKQAERTVRDPVTGLDVIIHDADFSSETNPLHSHLSIQPCLLSQNTTAPLSTRPIQSQARQLRPPAESKC